KGMNDILKMTPDVIFINIDGSQHLGSQESVFSFCKEVKEHTLRKPRFIALSKDSSLAYLAIKHRFYDYLLKPGEELEIRKTLLQLLKNQQHFLEDTLCLKSYKDYSLLQQNEILYLEADNN